jgi:predicted outer membrane lipoprotein
MSTKSTAAERARPVAEPGMLVLLCVTAWAIPGAGHLWLGRVQKGVVFFAALTTMFVVGLMLRGRLFPFDLGEPLVALAAIANAGLGLPWILGRALALGDGVVTAVTYEYGNTFLIVAGLLNFLIVLDVYDIGTGRK